MLVSKKKMLVYSLHRAGLVQYNQSQADVGIYVHKT